MAIVPIAGMFEAHLIVSDLDRSVAFYRDVLRLEVAHAVPDRRAAFLWIGWPGAAMLGLWSVHSSPLFMRLHVAFRVALLQIEAAVPSLRAAGVAPRSSGGGPGWGRDRLLGGTSKATIERMAA